MSARAIFQQVRWGPLTQEHSKITFFEGEVVVRNYFCLFMFLVIGWLSTFGQVPTPKTGQVNESRLPPVEVWNLLRSEDLSIVTRVEELPKSVRAALAQKLHQAELDMGDRDHKINAHCADCLVFRLIFAGISPEGCFVYYSVIGLAPSYQIILFDTKTQKRARPLWVARGVLDDDLDELRSSVAKGEFHSLPIE
jgi:hypothetical protein